FLACWIATATGGDMWQKVQHREGMRRGFKQLSLSYYGMVIAHLGIAVAVIGVGYSSHYSDERILRMETGQTVTMSGYDFTLESIRSIKGANYRGDEAVVRVGRNQQSLFTL